MMNRTRVVTIVAAVLLFALVVLVGIGYVSFSLGLPKTEVSRKIKELYELANPGTSVEVLSLLEEGSMYRAVVKSVGSAGTNYAEVYVSRDGKLLTQNVIFVDQSIQQIKSLKDFVDCLDKKGLRIFGVLNQTENPQGATATTWQLNILGIYSLKLYVSCDGNLIQNCIRFNITQVPSVVFENRIEPGIKTIQWFENATGCKF